MKNMHEMFNQWREFLSSDKMLVEINQETILSNYKSAKKFIEDYVKTDFSAFYCLNLLIQNLSSYTKYLEIPESSDENFLGFKLKDDILFSGEDELTDDNVKSLITFTYQCLEILLNMKPNLKSENELALLNLKNKIKKEEKEERLQDGTI